MRDLLLDYERLSTGGPVGRAVVTQVWGSAPRREGATMLATADGRTAGSVSGGCVENAVVEAIREALRSGKRELLRFAVSDETAWNVGLSCGGTIHVLVEPEVRDEVLAAARTMEDAVVPTVIAGPQPLGRPDPGLARQVEDAARSARSARQSRTTTVKTPGGEVTVLLEVFARRPTLLLIGAVHVAEVLTQLAPPLGYRVIVADARETLLTRERFAQADSLLLGWPAEVFSRVGLDDTTCVCLLTHDPKFDDPAMELALRSPAAYIGAIGSRKTQESRRKRLLEKGFTESDLARVHGPVGLDLGGRDPADIALAILAEIALVRHGGRIPAGLRR